ncbi:MAG: prepilin peptidase [Ignavibacteriales bacterium]|nr:prepilin peptidase [Ignavibacteriales bacterium]
MSILIIFLFGLSFGSFANNVISYYVNSSKFDIFKSSCACGSRKLKFYENIPVISYILQKGKCRECKNKLPIRYIFIELCVGIIAIICYLMFYNINQLILFFFLAYVLFIIGIIDLMVYIIPNALLISLFALALINLIFYQQEYTGNIILAFSLLSFFILLNYLFSKLIKKEAMGYGDIKLIFIIALFFGYPLALIGVWLSALISIPGIYLLKAIDKKRRNEIRIPYGFFLCICFIFFILFEDNLFVLLKNLGI